MRKAPRDSNARGAGKEAGYSDGITAAARLPPFAFFPVLPAFFSASTHRLMAER